MEIYKDKNWKVQNLPQGYENRFLNLPQMEACPDPQLREACPRIAQGSLSSLHAFLPEEVLSYKSNSCPLPNIQTMYLLGRLFLLGH